MSEQTLGCVLAIPVIYFAGVGLGRLLKHRAGVRLGALYKLFCVALAVYLPLRMSGRPLRWGGVNLLEAFPFLLTILGAAFLLSLLDRWVWDAYFERKRQTQIPKLLRQTLALLTVVIVAILVLKYYYGQPIDTVVLSSTVVVGIIGFAMQDLLGNVIAGIALQVGRPFRHGDWLKVENEYGEVMEVNWRSTRLRTTDHISLDIPNAEIVKNTIINLNYPHRNYAMRLRFGIDYNQPPNKVKKVLLDATYGVDNVLNTPSPKVFLVDFGDSSITYEVKFWMENQALYSDTCDAIRTNIWYALQRADIKIPFPIRTLQIEPRQRVASPEQASRLRMLMRRQSVFQELGDEHIERISAAARPQQFGAGERIIEQEAEGDSMFVLVRGKAAVLVQRNGLLTQVATLNTGDCFGEMSLLTGARRSATVSAQGDCEVMEIEKNVFAVILEENPDLLQKLSELLAQRQMENEGVLETVAQDVEVTERRARYAAGFLSKLYRFFDL